jgi:alkanesulfonate monooxygenase SsuD/methylene tetrahydromethanopterin reductase-like flavin-dependent oxidoreductase (luciferase family)
VTRFDEAIQVVRSLLTNDRTTFDGEIYTIADAPSDPKPVQSPLPLLVGTGSPRMLRITARHADEWNTWGGTERAAKRREGFATACESVGRDPTSMWTSVQALVVLSNDRSVIDTARSGPMESRTIAGSADELVDRLGRYASNGFDEFIVPDWNLGDSAEERRDRLAELHERVLTRT